MKENNKLIIIEIFIILITLANLIFIKIHPYGIVLFLTAMYGVLWRVIGTNKKKQKTKTGIYLEVAEYLLTFFILYYLYGLLIGFKLNPVYTVDSFVNKIIPCILFIFIREKLRIKIIPNLKDKKLIVLSIITFICMDLSYGTYLLTTDIFEPWICVLLSMIPTIANNIVLSYLMREERENPILFYLMVIGLYSLVLPILPNGNIFVETIIMTLLPILLWVRIYSLVQSDEEVPIEERIKNMIILVLPTIVVIGLVYFYSGYFRYYAIAISTDSMSPKINRGDLVIVDQKITNYEKIKVGEVIAYKKDNHYVVQRVIGVRKEKGKCYYETQEDASINPGITDVSEEMLVGTVSVSVRYLGYPTILLNRK